MEETYNSKVIIINSQPFRENDSRVAVFSMDRGRMDLIARGTKKLESKLAGHLESINFVKLMVVHGRQFDYIGSALNLNCYLKIKNNLEKIKCAGMAMGLVDKIIKQKNALDAKNIFLLIKIFLDFLNSSHDLALDYKSIYNFFALKLASELGYRPELMVCLECKDKISPGKNFFDCKSGGLICENCRKGERKFFLKISDNCIKILRLAVLSNWSELKKIKIDKNLNQEVFFIVNKFLEYNFDFIFAKP